MKVRCNIVGVKGNLYAHTGKSLKLNVKPSGWKQLIRSILQSLQSYFSPNLM